MEGRQVSMSGFLVLGFAIFIVGLLAGMLAMALIQVQPDLSTLWVEVFAFGFASGAVACALVLFVVRLARSHRKP